VTVYNKNGDLCSLQKNPPLCPIAQGNLNITKSVNLPSWAPSGTFHVKARHACERTLRLCVSGLRSLYNTPDDSLSASRSVVSFRSIGGWVGGTSEIR
jgi:hypothetical protein